MSSMSIKTFLEVAPRLPRQTSILIRGDHGIGKSDVMRQLAAGLGLPLIDRRLSQMSEGDLIGLPTTDGEVTKFNPPDWYMQACRNPVCLFFDELNRAVNEVQQSAFQIVLDRELNGWKLHPETLVVAAVNTGSAYTVNEMDPALLDRFWTIDLAPSHADFMQWGRGRLPDVVMDYLALNEKFLDTPKNADPGNVNTSRRSWARLGGALVGAGIINEPQHMAFFHVCLGYVGQEAAASFVDFAKEQDAHFSGEEIINSYDIVRPKLKKLASQDRWNTALEKAGDFIASKLTNLDETQKKNLRAFTKDLPGELRVALWNTIAKPGVEKIDLVKDAHGVMNDLIIEAFKKEEKKKAKAAGANGEKEEAK